MSNEGNGSQQQKEKPEPQEPEPGSATIVPDEDDFDPFAPELGGEG